MTEQGESRNVVNGAQAELAEVRPGRWMIPHAGTTPPAPTATVAAKPDFRNSLLLGGCIPPSS